MKIISTFNLGKTNINKPQKQIFDRFFMPKNTVNNKNLEKDTFSYSTNSISFTGRRIEEAKKTKYREVIKTLTLFSDNAQKSFDEQYKKDGIMAKSVDNISALWGSSNRSKLVKEDIIEYNNNIEELNSSIDKKTFPQTFEKIFGIKYNQKNIDEFHKVNEQLILASTTKYMYDSVHEKLKDDLELSQNNNGVLKDYVKRQFIPYATTGSVPYVYIRVPKEDIYSRMEKSITEAVGSKESLEAMLSSQNVKPDAKPEEKYPVYCNIANFLLKTSKMTADKCSQGKTLKDLKKDYDNAYEKAFGNSNDIQKRVDNYNRSQQIGKSMLKTGIRNPMRLALFGLMGLTNPVATIPVGVAISYGLDMLEKATNPEKDVELSKESLKTLMNNTAESYVYCAVEAGLEAIVPLATTGNQIVNSLLSTARDTAVTVTTNLVTDYMTTGEWNSSQIAPRALVQFVFARIPANDRLSKDLLSMTKGGVKDALLYDNDNKNSVKKFMNKLQVELQKGYMNNPELYASMKAVSMNNPEIFEKMILDLLQEHIDKENEKNTKSKNTN